MPRVNRKDFVLPEHRSEAGGDYPLPIGYQQTISQPSLVEDMTNLLELQPDDRVLEIGTGSGYQAAILSERVAEVYTLEIIPELAESAEKRLQQLGFDNVRVKKGDGYRGWPEAAPFDAIVITAAIDHFPEPLLEQLREGGRTIFPQGKAEGPQNLLLGFKDSGQLETKVICPVRFVPFTGRHE